MPIAWFLGHAERGPGDKSISLETYEKHRAIPQSIQAGQQDGEGILRGMCYG